MNSEELQNRCRSALGKPLQKGYRRLGFPSETKYDGQLFEKLLDKIAEFAEVSKCSPTGFSVRDNVALTFEQMRQLEKELGRPLCNSGDVLFGSIQIGAFFADEDPGEGDRNWIDCRELMETESD